MLRWVTMIKYIGSKRALMPAILEAVGAVPGASRVLDLFSGTSRVGHALKGAGYQVLANDSNAYAATLARCYVEADAQEVLEDARRLIEEFQRLPGAAGYFTETFCVRSRFIRPVNGERIDAIREAIAAKGLEPELEAVVLTSLVEAADRVDSTTGVQMAYLKEWAPRAMNELELRVPAVLGRAVKGKGRATCLDALEAGRLASGTWGEADVAYLDPPYNRHSYLGNYHVWESLVRWDKPETYGVACKRVDVQERVSSFNSRVRCRGALREVLEAVRARVVIVSFSDEGHMTSAEVEETLGGMWAGGARVVRVEREYDRYVGAKIGIYNPRGEKVGTVGRLRNKEYLYIVTRRGSEEEAAVEGPIGARRGAGVYAPASA
jgi:adenine-specific DNA-methyltransferase